MAIGVAAALTACGGGNDPSNGAAGAAGLAAVSSSSASTSSSSASSSSSTSSDGSSSSPPGGVTLEWTVPNENTDGTAVSNGELAGYKVVFGESASALDQSVAITDPAVTTYTFQNLPSGTWYFAIVAVDAEGDDSTPTNTISASL